MSFLFDVFRQKTKADAVVAALAAYPEDPTHQDSGTSYIAKGAVVTPPAALFEVGSKLGQTFPDPVPELSALPNAQLVYRKMIRGDASVRISLRAAKAPVLGADYYIEPYDDSEECAIHAELLEFNLKHGMDIPWLKFLEQLVTCYENGFSTFEPLWEMREWAPTRINPSANKKLYTMLDQFALRPAETISEWVFDTNGHLEGVWQNAYNQQGGHAEVFIPRQKLLIFTFEQFGNDPRGMSILRSAYPHWYYKSYFYKIDGIQKERHGVGIPDIELQPGFSPADKATAHELGANMRANEKSYVVRNPMIKVGFVELQGQPIDVLRSAIHHDDMIMKNVLIQYLQQGVGESGGGRATSATSQDMFMKASRYLASSFMDILNEDFVPQLIGYNFDTDKFPRIRVRNVGEVKDFQAWSAGVANLLAQNGIQIDDQLEQYFREQADFPRRTSPWIPVEERTQKVTEVETKQLDTTANGNGSGSGSKGDVTNAIKSDNTGKGTSPT